MSSKSTEEGNDGKESDSLPKRAKIHEHDGDDERRSEETIQVPQGEGESYWKEQARKSNAEVQAAKEEIKAAIAREEAAKEETKAAIAREEAAIAREEVLKEEVQAAKGETKAAIAREEAANAREEVLKEEAYEKSIACLVEQPLNIIFKGEGTSSSHIGAKGHTAATFQEKEIKLENIKNDAKITERWNKETSTFLNTVSKRIVEGKLTYKSEADVSHWIGLVLEDAMTLATMKTGRHFAMYHEFSMFSIRPDHVVVVDCTTGAPILVVEDKKPFNRQLDNHVHRFVMGQVRDYIKVTRAFGSSMPFVVLSTFRENWLCWQDDEDSNTLAMDLVARADALAKYFTTDSPTRQKSEQEKNKTPSPRAIKEEQNSGQDVGVTFRAPTNNTNDQSLFVSKAVETKDLVGLLYTAILCGLCRNPNSHKHVLKRYPTGYNGEAMRLLKNKKGYTWGHLKCRAADEKDKSKAVGIAAGVKRRVSEVKRRALGRGAKRKPEPNGADGAYYIIDLIGRGATSKAFLAFDEDGKECVIKMYVKKDDEYGENLETQAMTERAKEHCMNEVQNFKKIYGDNSLNVSCELLNGFWCVIMPFFSPLPKSERARYYGKIKTVLRRFGANKLQYCESDICWRHIGLHGDDEIVMFDLANLNSLDRERPSTMVQNCLTILEGRCQQE